MEEFKEVDEEVKGIIIDMVSPQTKVSYRNSNVVFLFWIYDGTHKAQLLNRDFVTEMDDVKKKKKKKRH